MIGAKVKVLCPVVFCSKTGKQAVLEGDVGSIQGSVPICGQMGLAILFPDFLPDGRPSDVLDNGHIKQWSFFPHELEIVDANVPNSQPIYSEEDSEINDEVSQ